MDLSQQLAQILSEYSNEIAEEVDNNCRRSCSGNH